MINPNMFMKKPYSQARPNQQINSMHQNININSFAKNIELQKLAGYQRSRWDEAITVPLILYQKFKVNPPNQNNSKVTFENQVNNNYPPSLIDFIKKAYLRCKDTNKKKLMQNQLRQIIEKNNSNLNLINWQNYPLPNISNISDNNLNKQSYLQQKTFMMPGTNKFVPAVQKQTIPLPNLYNQSLIDKIQKPNTDKQSRIKSIVQTKLQMLAEKYGKQKVEQQLQPQNKNIPVKNFIGFKDQHQVKLEQQRLKYEQMAQKMKQASIINKQINVETPKLQVIQSKVPEKVYQVKKIQPIVNMPQNDKKQIKNQKITKKELQNIVKEAKQNKEELKTVAKRFTEFYKIKGNIAVQIQQENDNFEDIDFKIVGKCKKIDKPYLRITHRPDPQTVRPEAILRKAFNHYKAEYKKGVSYDLIISQFRSIRQDLTVQDIRNSFTVQVYEQNMKMSLFEDDIIQFKQCQTNLWQLYRQGLYNKRADRTKYISYHFICMIMQQRYKELQYMLTLISPQVLEEKQIQQSLKLKRYLVIGNYKAFFDFYSGKDQTCQKLMNQFIDKVRVKCLVMICKTFGEKIKFIQIAQNIGEDQDILEVLARQEGAIINQDYIMLKQSYQILKNSQYLQIKKVTSLLD